jgi:tetratricopeptide (TPR) repeat protein
MARGQVDYLIVQVYDDRTSLSAGNDHLGDAYHELDDQRLDSLEDYLSTRSPKEYGKLLFRSALPGMLGTAYQRWWDRAYGRGPCGLALVVGSDRLRRLRWECLLPDTAKVPLSCLSDVGFTRNLATGGVWERGGERDRPTVLVGVADPLRRDHRGMDPIDDAQVFDTVRRALRGVATVSTLGPKVTLDRLGDRLRNPAEPQVDILHLVAHGYSDGRYAEIYLDGPARVTAEQLAACVGSTSVLAVVLVACDSGASHPGQPLPISFAERFLEQTRLTAVVAMSIPIEQAAARRFTQGLYSKMLSEDLLQIDLAVNAGRGSVYANGGFSTWEWSGPILFWRGGDALTRFRFVRPPSSIRRDPVDWQDVYHGSGSSLASPDAQLPRGHDQEPAMLWAQRRSRWRHAYICANPAAPEPTARAAQLSVPPDSGSAKHRVPLAKLRYQLERHADSTWPGEAPAILATIEQALEPGGDRLLEEALATPGIGFGMVELSLDAGQPALAAAWAAELTRLLPGDRCAVLLAGIAHECNGDLEAALTECEILIGLDPGNALAYVRRAEVFRARAREVGSGQGDLLGQALADCHTAVDLSPRRAEGHLELARALASLEQQEAAIKAYHRALGLQARQWEAHRELGQLLLDQELAAEALDAFDNALKLGGEDPGALVGKGNALSALGDDARALNCFQKAVELDQINSAAVLGLAQAATNYGHRLRRRHQLDDAEAHYNHALNAGESAVRLDEGGVWAHLHLARALRAVRGYDRAADHFRKAVELAEGNQPALVTLHAEAGATLREWGAGIRDERLLDRGMLELAKAGELTEDPAELVWIHDERGRIQLAMGRVAEALAAFDESIALEAEYGWALINRATALLRLGRREEAAASFQRLRDAASDRGWFIRWAKVGLLVTRSRRRPVGTEALPATPQANDYLDRAHMFEVLRWYDQAEHDRVMALGLEPDQPEPYLAVASTYLAERFPSIDPTEREFRLEVAIERITRARELIEGRESDPLALELLGWAKLQRGDLRAAVEHLEQAQEGRPLDVVIRERLRAARSALYPPAPRLQRPGRIDP